jgi:hypothetical protein
MKNNQEELWITNINRLQDITLGDLRITVRRGQSINLLAKKKNGLSLYNLTRKQIDTSIEKGSIYQKGHHIKIRTVSPEVIVPEPVVVAHVLETSTKQRIKRKPQEIEQVSYPDLDMNTEAISIEKIAAENADLDIADRAPVLSVDPVFKNVSVDE